MINTTYKMAAAGQTLKPYFYIFNEGQQGSIEFVDNVSFQFS